MSVALRRIRDRVRGRIRDTDARNSTYDAIEVDQAICDAYLVADALLPAPSLYIPNAFTITAGLDTFTLPTAVTGYTGNDGGAEYAGDVRIQLASSGQFLWKRSLGEMDSLRNLSLPTHLSIPSDFCLWEEADQEVHGRCYPGARVNELCHLFVTMAADDLRDFVGAGTDDLDDAEILFSRAAATALVMYTAADLLERMPEEEAQKRRLNPKVAPSWRQEAERLLYREAGRRHDLEDIGRVQRVVS